MTFRQSRLPNKYKAVQRSEIVYYTKKSKIYIEKKHTHTRVVPTHSNPMNFMDWKYVPSLLLCVQCTACYIYSKSFEVIYYYGQEPHSLWIMELIYCHNECTCHLQELYVCKCWHKLTIRIKNIIIMFFFYWNIYRVVSMNYNLTLKANFII